MSKDDSGLQPIDEDLTEIAQRRGKDIVAKATARAELQQICDDAAEGELLDIDAKLRFAIRHILILTTLVAIVTALYKSGGGVAAFVGFFVFMLIWGYVFANDREREHEKKIAKRLEEFKKRHGDADLGNLDVNMIWKLSDRESS